MNILGVIHTYKFLKSLSEKELKEQVPRVGIIIFIVVIFAGKSAPGYYIAKLIIKLINNVANVINDDDQIQNVLKVFIYLL